MQAAKKAVETLKETAANIGASAKSGLEKTKATIQEKSEKISAHDQSQKDMATQKKEEKINQAEMEKQQAREHNAAAKQSAVVGHMTQGHYTTTGPGTEPVTIDTTGPRTETATNNTTGPGFENVVHSNIGTGTATYNTSGPGHESVLLSSTGPGNATYNTSGPGHDDVFPCSTGPRPETATHPAGDYGQMGANQTTVMRGHGPGPGQGGLTDDVVGSHPIETNSGVGTTAQTTLGAGSASPSGPNFS